MIPHNNENSIRANIRHKKHYNTTTKQHFLSKWSMKRQIVRSVETRCKSCICIPKCDVPEKFFTLIGEWNDHNNGLLFSKCMHNNNNSNHVTKAGGEEEDAEDIHISLSSENLNPSVDPDQNCELYL